MSKDKTDLILHPLRFRLLQTLFGKQLTTYQISQDLPDIPVSSIYRHLKILLDAGLVQVTDTNRIKGIDEKVYTVGEIPTLSENAFMIYNNTDRLRYFASYLSYLLRRFSEFLSETDTMEKDKAGFTENLFYAAPAELDEFRDRVLDALKPLLANEKSPQRQRQLFSVITFPVERKEE